jgi:hypothetical protein
MLTNFSHLPNWVWLKFFSLLILVMWLKLDPNTLRVTQMNQPAQPNQLAFSESPRWINRPNQTNWRSPFGSASAHLLTPRAHPNRPNQPPHQTIPPFFPSRFEGRWVGRATAAEGLERRRRRRRRVASRSSTPPPRAPIHLDSPP